MSGPLTGRRRAGGDARERPVFPARSAGLRGQSWAPAAERPGHVRGLRPWCCRADGKSSPLTGRRAARPRARRPVRLALAAARRAARAVCRRPGRAAAASRSSSPGGVPADFAGCAGISRRPGTRARCLAARAWRRAASAAGARTVSRPVPGTGSGRDAIHGPAPDDRPAPPPGPPGVGMKPAQPSAAPSPPWPGSDRAARASPKLPAWTGGTGAGGLPVLLRAAVSPHRPSGPCPDFFESCCSSWSPVTESNRRPSPYH
jgi:hypothetical protein